MRSQTSSIVMPAVSSSIACGLERGHLARGVRLVARDDVGEDHLGIGLAVALLGVLQRTAARPLLGACREKYLDLGVGKDDGPDVAALHGDVVVGRDGALLLDERLAHGRHRAHSAHDTVDARRADVMRAILSRDGDARGDGVSRLVRELDPLVGGDARERIRIGQVDAALQRAPGDAAVHGARVEVVEVEHLGHLLGDGGFTRARRPVDCDDHREISPSKSNTFRWSVPASSRQGAGQLGEHVKTPPRRPSTSAEASLQTRG